MIHEISGYWKDNKDTFYDYLVADNEDVTDFDEDIFLYGLSEKDIKEEIELSENTEQDFVIMSYRKVK